MHAVITGVGALSPLGLDLETFWNSILAEKSCVETGLGAFSSEQWQDIEKLVPSRGDPREYCGKLAQISYFSALEAMKKASWTSLGPDDGLILGTTTGQVLHWESSLMDAYIKNNFDEFIKEGGILTPGRSLSQLSRLLNFKGKSLMVVSACSASTQALGLAAEWVKSGRVKRCLVGGAEVLTQLSVEGFRSLGLLSTGLSKPFDEKRSGINLSEAAAFYCVEAAQERTSRAVAVIKGFATNSDAYHLTAPHPEGSGTYATMQESLKVARVSPEQIDWIHAHGTASPSNDKAEGIAISKIFPQTSVTSTKAYHGHSLGASGALETAICIQALRQQIKIKSLGCDNLDPALKINIQKTHEKADLKYILKNSLGFGGVNATLVLAHPSTLEHS